MIEDPNITTIQQTLEGERERLRQHLQVSSDSDQTKSKNPDHMDIAQAYSDQERFYALLTLEQKQLAQVEAALRAIAEGSYGHCQHCRQPIPLERLQILPHAMMCVNCQAQHD